MAVLLHPFVDRVAFAWTRCFCQIDKNYIFFALNSPSIPAINQIRKKAVLHTELTFCSYKPDQALLQ